MYLFYNLGRFSVRVNEQTRLLEVEKDKEPMPYRQAAELAKASAESDSEKFRRHAEAPDNTHLYYFSEGNQDGSAR
jgi:hypothetical protein